MITSVQAAQTSQKGEAKTVAKQIETVFLNELLKNIMEHTSFGQDRTVSTFLPFITTEIAKSLAEKGIGIGELLSKAEGKGNNDNKIYKQNEAVNLLGNPPI